MTEQQQQIPPGATPIDPEEFLAAIGELYVQVRLYRKVIAQQQAARNGTAEDAVHIER